jgi:hypothetical protein
VTVTPRTGAGTAPVGQPDRLLVVDFDFFFPNPLDAAATDTQSLLLYDWGHAETRLHRETLWHIRATTFAAHSVALPRRQPTDGFWNRFTLATDELVVADSNAHAGPLAWQGGLAEVVLFDHHHDSGYRRSYADYLTDGEFTCEDWTFPHHEASARITVRYPRWRGNWTRLEPSTAIPCCATLKNTTCAAFRMPTKIPANRTAGLVKCRPSSARCRERPVGCTPQRALARAPRWRS